MKTDYPALFGQQIRAKRKERGLTIKALAQKAGIAHQNLWKIENGKYNPSLDYLALIAEALGCKIVFVPKEDAL